MSLDIRFLRTNSLATQDGQAGYNMRGGRYSADEIVDVIAELPYELTGVNFTSASSRNLRGGRVGYLNFNYDYGYFNYSWNYRHQMSWKAPGSPEFGPTLDVPLDPFDISARIELYDGYDPDKYLLVEVAQGELPLQNFSDLPVMLLPSINNIFDDATPLEAEEGMTDYRCVVARNVGDSSWTTASLWLETNISSTTVSNFSGYATEGEITINVASTIGYPKSAYIFNRNYGEIMLYDYKTPTSFHVPVLGRGALGSTVTGGEYENTIDYYVPIDVGVGGSYPTVTVSSYEARPFGITFAHPLPNSPLSATVVNGEFVPIWLGRQITPGMSEVGKLRFDLILEAA